MPVFGADPDSEGVEWEDMPSTTRYVSRPVRELTNYFSYHRNMRMSQRCNEEDKSMLNIMFSRRLKQGFTAPALMEIIDRFYQSPSGQVDYPAPMFCKNDVQRDLMEDAEVDKGDTILQWLLDGMPDDLPAVVEGSTARRAITLYSDESQFRYPEVVAEVVTKARSEDDLRTQLIALDSVIYWNMGEDDDDIESSLKIISEIGCLPKELRSKVRSPKSIRDKKATLREAVLSIPIRRKKEAW